MQIADGLQLMNEIEKIIPGLPAHITKITITVEFNGDNTARVELETAICVTTGGSTAAFYAPPKIAKRVYGLMETDEKKFRLVEIEE